MTPAGGVAPTTGIPGSAPAAGGVPATAPAGGAAAAIGGTPSTAPAGGTAAAAGTPGAAAPTGGTPSTTPAGGTAAAAGTPGAAAPTGGTASTTPAGGTAAAAGTPGAAAPTGGAPSATPPGGATAAAGINGAAGAGPSARATGNAWTPFCRAWGMSPGLAARSCKMLRHGTPGLVCVTGFAVAGLLHISAAQYTPAVAKAMIAKRFVVRDMSLQLLWTPVPLGNVCGVSQSACATIVAFIKAMQTRGGPVTTGALTSADQCHPCD
jgi:hypothetical protein